MGTTAPAAATDPKPPFGSLQGEEKTQIRLTGSEEKGVEGGESAVQTAEAVD